MLNSLFPHSYESPFSPIKFEIFGKALSVTDTKRNTLTRNFDSGNFTSKLGCLNICNEKYHHTELPSTRDMMILRERFVDIGQNMSRLLKCTMKSGT